MVEMRGRLLLLAASAAALSGCVLPELNLQGRQCPCAPGWYCQRGVCMEGEADAEVPDDDGGAGDAGPTPDSGRPGDGGDPDAGDPRDGGEPRDGGLEDGGVDAGVVDAGPDAGPRDTGPDAGPEDGGLDGGPSPTACVTDAPCDAPRTVCRGGTCQPGCGHGGPGCTGNATCDGATGRCFDAAASCTTAAQCGDGAPFQVCAGGQCRYACGVSGAAGCVGDRQCAPNGYCGVAPTCVNTADCADPEFVCTAGHCTRRCDAPEAQRCLGNSTCSTSTGRCEGASPLGQTCAAHADCASGHCLTITSPSARSFCTRSCGGTADCPLDTSCLPVDGAMLCVPESVFSVQMDDPSGEACSGASTQCQSQLCLANVCTERCVSDRQCDATGTPCVTVRISGTGGTVFVQECIPATGALGHGQVCPNDDDTLCQRGVCNRYTNRCEQGCCADADCGANESCLVYDLAFDTPYPTCQPRSGSGVGALGASCASNATCATDNCAPRDPGNLGGPRACTTHCCTDFDCAGYPGGARCAPLPAPGTGGRLNYCVPLIP
jgi:hypothetical protein